MRVCQQEQLDSCVAVSFEHWNQALVQHNIFFRMDGNFVLDDSVPMAKIDRFSDMTLIFFIVFEFQEFILTLVFELDEQGKELCVDELKQSIHVDKRLFRKAHDLVEVFGI
jgi:hypothetical protein